MVVVDNNVLSALSKIERLGLLEALFDQPVTVAAVVDELHRDAVADYDFVTRIDEVKRYNGGWLGIVSLSEEEIELAETVLDESLSFTDAQCIAAADSRNERLLTDDGHVGETASQRGVEVWDLKLVLEAAVETGLVEGRDEFDGIVVGLRENDNYRLSAADREDLYDRL
jgi:predicted nucleic acid-binding protein